MTLIFFYIIAATVVAGALGVVLIRSTVYAALFLIMSLLGVAGIYILLSVEFLALVQVLIYGGAVMVLIIFAIFMTPAAISSRSLSICDLPIATTQWSAG